jgi:hypothetical protein
MLNCAGAAIVTFEHEEHRQELHLKRSGGRTDTEFHRSWTLSAKLPQGRVRRVELQLSIDCESAWCLSHSRRLVPVNGTAVPPYPAGRFAVVRTPGGLFEVTVHGGQEFTIFLNSGSARISACLFDPAKCGLSLWGPGKIEPPAEIQVDVSVDRLDTLEDCAWVEPYPSGARAAICITDHPDFDSAEKARLMYGLLCRNNIRLTKSVFPRAAAPLAGLNDDAYAHTIEDLHAFGCEIAFHGFDEGTSAPRSSECRDLVQSMMRFRPSTWIDHGRGDYLFSRRARLADGVSLTSFLGDCGVRNYWSYVDVWENPFDDLCSWSTRRGIDTVRDLVSGFRIVRPRTVSQAGFLLLQVAKNLLSSDALKLLLHGRPEGLGKAVRTASRLPLVRRRPLGIYGLDGLDFSLTNSDVWVFDTILLNHLSVQLRPEVVDRLCRESGLLLAHVYLSCEHRHHAGRPIPESGKGFAPALVCSLEYIAERQRAGDLATLTFSALRNRLSTFRRARLVRHADGWKIAPPEIGEDVWLGCAADSDGSLHQRTRLRNGAGFLTGSGDGHGLSEKA